MSDNDDIPDITKQEQGFISHVFNFDTKSKHEIMNTIQYSILAVLPVVLLNKTIQRLIPEADENKASLEIIFEVISQLGIIFVGIFLIHRIITYFPTYSESKYDSFSIINCVVSFLIIILSLQTKLGEKMNIITDRFLHLIQGTPQQNVSNEANELSEYSVPVMNNPIPKQPIEEGHTSNGNMFQDMATPMAANDALGGAFGSSF
tara:strand:- start:167 stop:781 length:615 start_codon:yes stop_codon:yes gene_type:complete